MFQLFIVSFLIGVLCQSFFLADLYFGIFVVVISFYFIATRFFDYSNGFLKTMVFGLLFGFFWSLVFSGSSFDFAGLYENVFLLKSLQHLKEAFLLKLNNLFYSPENAFLAGLLVGERSSIPPDLKIAFNVTGLTHIVAISGYNISLVILLIFRIFMFLPQKPRICVASVFIILFVFFVGFSAPVLRAAVCGIIALIAMFFNREYLALRALLICAFLMVLFSPDILAQSISFQLSFFATLGILLFSESLKKFFSFLPQKFAVRESVVMTFSAQVLVLPIILANFGTLSLISPVANLLVLPLIPLVMLTGFFAVVGSFIFGFLGMIFAFLTHLVLGLLLFFVDVLSRVSYAQVELDWFGFEFGFIYYFLIFWFMGSRVVKKN